MPAFEIMDRWQTAVLWSDAGVDDYGRTKVRAATEILVRWVQKRSEMLDVNGNVVGLDATAVVNQKIGIGSIMYLGDYDVFTGTGSGSADPAVELMEVRVYDETKDIKCRHVRRTVGLVRYRGILPTVI